MTELKNTIKLFRFPFSLFLLPISLFSLCYIQPEYNFKLFLVLFSWHFLVYPSCNGYNSYHDRDEGPIGGLASPPKPTELLLHLSNLLDGTAIALSFFVNYYFVCFVAVCILLSRLYSNKKIHLKKFPIVGFSVVFIFQGAWVFCANIFALSSIALFENRSVVFGAIASSCLIGTIYPLTQIYQHEADRKDGVKTISMLLGIKGTFIFSACLYALATFMIYLSSEYNNRMNNFWLFTIIMFPSLLYFSVWAIRSFRNPIRADFKNTMIMLLLSSLLNNIYFLILLLN